MRRRPASRNCAAPWRAKMLKDNPSLEGKSYGNPIVTNALTHGISIVSDLSAEAGTPLVVPNKNWENYELTFGVRRGAGWSTSTATMRAASSTAKA